MDIRTHANFRRITAIPTNGEFISTPKYIMFKPNKGVMFSPVLIHVDLEDLMNVHVDTINKLLSGPLPPLFLLTDGRNRQAGVDFCDYISIKKLNGAINAIISINNPSSPDMDSYQNLHDNLPSELISLLDTMFQRGKIIGEGNPIAETVSSLLNKPCVSYHMLGNPNDFDDLVMLLDNIPEYPTFNYVKDCRYTPPALADDRCACCGRVRKPLIFFHGIQNYLCPVCARKIKSRGKVNLVNWYACALELRKERILTHKANMRNATMDKLECPHGCRVHSSGKRAIIQDALYSNYKCPVCGRVYQRRGVRLFEFVEGASMLDPNVSVYEYNEGGKVHHAYMQRMSLTPVKKCYVCNKPTIQYHEVVNRTQGYTDYACKECLAKYRGNNMKPFNFTTE